MTSFPIPVSQVRLAGLCYLVIILCGIGAEMVLRGPLIDQSSATDTAHLIQSQMLRFRLSILADIGMALADATLATLLFLLFRTVSAALALAALVFRLLQSGLIAAGLLNLQAASLLLQAGGQTADPDLVLSFLMLHAYGYDLGLIFFGVNCLLTALLGIRSGFVPRLLGVGIGLSGLVYLTGSIVRFGAPEMHESVVPAYILPLVAETAFCLWLMILPGQRASQPSLGTPAG